MKRYRVVESDEGLFYPQAPVGGFLGFFRSWKFFYHDADKLKYPQRSIFVITDSIDKSANFADEQSAHDFLERTTAAVDKGWRAVRCNDHPSTPIKIKRITEGYGG
jgi:hypothetical protein